MEDLGAVPDVARHGDEDEQAPSLKRARADDEDEKKRNEHVEQPQRSDSRANANVNANANTNPNEPQRTLRKKRLVVRTLLVAKKDLPKLLSATRGSAFPQNLGPVVREITVAGPTEGRVVEGRVTKCRIYRPSQGSNVSEAVISSAKPQKKTTALLWSKREFLRRVAAHKKKKANKRERAW